MAALQTVLLDSVNRQAYAGALEWLGAQRFLQRLWDHDASLWSADHAVQATIQRRLGWLNIPSVMAREAGPLRQFAQEICGAGLTHALLLGMGGSALFSEVCRKTFGVVRPSLDLEVLDTTDPAAILAAQQRCPLSQLLVILSSKSGLTTEVSALSKYFYEAFTLAGIDPGAHCIAITDHGTPLEAQAAAWKCRRVFAHGEWTGAQVGGRFSALTYFGLVPAALMGIDTNRLLTRAREMLQYCDPHASPPDNPATQLGALLGSLAAHGKDKLMLFCSPELASFGAWAEQLVAESTGKSGKGIAPLPGDLSRSPASYPPDRVFVELQLRATLDPTLDEYLRAVAAAGHPVIRIHWEDRYDLGGEVIKWSAATSIAGSLMGLNPFDEPNVQESKDRTRALLTQYTQHGAVPSESPLIAQDGVTVYGAPGSSEPHSIVQALRAWLQQARPQDYVVLLSFLPRTDASDAALRAIRARIASRFCADATIGVGPRYLHSTGQLYKGGPDAALFLLLTAEEEIDLPIPGEPYPFRVLKLAQALGDFQAMRQRNRRILRIHLAGDFDRAAQQLLNAIDEALAAAPAGGSHQPSP